MHSEERTSNVLLGQVGLLWDTLAGAELDLKSRDIAAHAT